MSSQKLSRGLRPWPELRREHLVDCTVFQVSRSWVRVPDGRSHPFYRIDADAWVNVVPITAEGELVMIRQFRHGSQTFTLEIPGGLVDPGETPLEAAGRELLEETGFRAGSVRLLGDVNPNPALFGNRVYSFVAEGCERVGEIENPGLEETLVELVPKTRLPEMVRRGEIDHALVLAALHLWSLDPSSS